MENGRHQWPYRVVNYVKFQCVQDRTNIIDRVNTGDEIKVYFNIKGSKWERDGKTNYIYQPGCLEN